MLAAACPREVGWGFSIEMAKIPPRMNIHQPLSDLCARAPSDVVNCGLGREGGGFCRTFAHLSQK